jgi:hypothetical protein
MRSDRHPLPNHGTLDPPLNDTNSGRAPTDPEFYPFFRSVAQTHLLAGYKDARRSYGLKELALPFLRMLSHSKLENVAPKPQLAIPVATIAHAAAARPMSHQKTKQSRTSSPARSIICCALESTPFRPPSALLEDSSFHCHDIRLWRAGRLLPQTATLQQLLQADGSTLTLDKH